MLVPANAPRELVDFSREEVNDKCPVCWETTEEDNGKLWCAHEHANADLTDGTRIIVLVHPLHKDCAKITYLFQKDYTYLKDCIQGADVKIMSVMPIPRSIRENLGYALIRNAETIALIIKKTALTGLKVRLVQLLLEGDVAPIGLCVGIVALHHMQAPQNRFFRPFVQNLQFSIQMGMQFYMQFFENLPNMPIIINDLGVRVIREEGLPLIDDILAIHNLGIRVIREEGLRLINDFAARIGAVRIEIVEEIEENI